MKTKGELHPLQEAIINLLKGGKSPSYRKMQKILNVSSTSLISFHVNQLIKKGYLIKDDTLKVVNDPILAPQLIEGYIYECPHCDCRISLEPIMKYYEKKMDRLKRALDATYSML